MITAHPAEQVLSINVVTSILYRVVAATRDYTISYRVFWTGIIRQTTYFEVSILVSQTRSM